jgi:hypothetical protein
MPSSRQRAPLHDPSFPACPADTTPETPSAASRRASAAVRARYAQMSPEQRRDLSLTGRTNAAASFAITHEARLTPAWRTKLIALVASWQVDGEGAA